MPGLVRHQQATQRFEQKKRNEAKALKRRQSRGLVLRERDSNTQNLDARFEKRKAYDAELKRRQALRTVAAAQEADEAKAREEATLRRERMTPAAKGGMQFVASAKRYSGRSWQHDDLWKTPWAVRSSTTDASARRMPARRRPSTRPPGPHRRAVVGPARLSPIPLPLPEVVCQRAVALGGRVRRASRARSAALLPWVIAGDARRAFGERTVWTKKKKNKPA